LARRLLGRQVALVAALLAAVNPYLVWYSHLARAYSLYLVLTLASLVLGDCVLRSAYCVSRRGGARSWQSLARWSAYVGVSVLSLYTHYFAFLFLVGQNLAFLLLLLMSRTTSRAARTTQYAVRSTRPWLAAQATIALLIAPWLLLAGPMLLGHEKPWLTYTPPAMALWHTLRAFSLGVDVRGPLVVPLTVLFALMLGVGIATTWRWRPPALIVLGAYLFTPLVIVLLGSLIRPIFLERYLIGVVPAFLVLVTAGVQRIAYCVMRRSAIRTTQYAVRTLVAFLFWTVLTALLLVSAFLAPPFGADIFDWRGVARALESRVGADDVVIQNYPDPAFAYYYRAPAERTVLPARVPVPRQETAEALRSLLREHDRVWLLPNRNPAWDGEGFVQAWLDRRAELVADEWVAGHRLLAYRAPSEPRPEIPHRLDWQLGDVARLAGYRLDVEQVAAGDSFELTLFWEPLRATDVAYTVFVHLWDGQTIWGQKDGEPANGTWPTTDWYPGDLIIDTREVPVKPETPPGEYQVIAGLYRWETGERLPVFDAKGRPRGDYVPLVELHVGH
ncbi:MAG: hypothetical protein D6791_10700, partial [Chloroflexi bacterium]